MSQIVPSASKAAVSIAFRRARRKFPKDYGYTPQHEKTCHSTKMESSSVRKDLNEKYQVSNEDLTKGNNKCDKITETLSVEFTDGPCANIHVGEGKMSTNEMLCKRHYHHYDFKGNGFKSDDSSQTEEIKKGTTYLAESTETSTCTNLHENNSKIDTSFANHDAELHNFKSKCPHCFYFCPQFGKYSQSNGTIIHDFPKKLHNWEHRVRKESSLKLKTTIQRPRTASSVTDIQQTHFTKEFKCTAQPSYHRHCLHCSNYGCRNNHYYHRKYSRLNRKCSRDNHYNLTNKEYGKRNTLFHNSVSNHKACKCTHQICCRRLSVKNSVTYPDMSETEDDLDDTAFKPLKHKDSVLILMEKLSVGKKNASDTHLKEKTVDSNHENISLKDEN